MNNDTMANDYYSGGESKPKGPLGKIFKWIVLAVVVLVYALIFFRIFIKNDPASAAKFVWTPEAVAAYRENPDGFVAQKQTIRSYNRTLGKDDNNIPIVEQIVYNDITSDGSFKISNLIYLPQTKELQITLRFNQYSIDTLMETYGLSEKPKGDIYFFALEGVGDGYLTDYSYEVSKRFTYEYRRLVFRNVDLSEADLVYLNIYYIEDVRLDHPLRFYADKDYAMEATLPIYDSYLGWEDVPSKDYLPVQPDDDLRNPPFVSMREQ